MIGRNQKVDLGIMVAVLCLTWVVQGESLMIDLKAVPSGIKWQGSLDAIKLVEKDGRSAIEFNKPGANIVWLRGFQFDEGVIEFDAKGKSGPPQSSFVGIAFRVKDAKEYDVVYFRPFNFRGADPSRQAHAVQYTSEPQWPWYRLRTEKTGQYEKPIVPAPDGDAWFHAKVVVAKGQISAYVNGDATPALSVSELSGRTGGSVGLWCNGYGVIANLKITPAGTQDDLPEVPRWEPHDFAFTASEAQDNPFEIDLSAKVMGPDGQTFTLPGFYDGNRTWKVRVSPTTEGHWSLVTQSDLPALNSQRAAFTCVPNLNPQVHGGLSVDPTHAHHFIHEDGTRYFLMGYECDWLWALDMDNPQLPTVNPFLDKLAAHGFNYIILNSYAHDTGWRSGKTSDHDYGPPAHYAWEGINEQPDHSRFNLAYWQHYDQVIKALHGRGITAHMLMKVYNKMVKWPPKGSAQDDLFFRWLIARYAAYPNIIWDFSKEAHNEKDLDYKLDRFRFIRENDPYHRLVTCHDDDKANDSGVYDMLTDFRADQHHSKWRDKVLQQRQRRAWPVVNVEFGYEHGPNGMTDKTYGVVQAPEDLVRRAWEISMAGGYTAYYYTYTAWDVVRPEDTPLGYDYFKHLRSFFETTRYWELDPVDNLVSQGWCLANPGKEYVVFLNQAAPFTLQVAAASSPLQAVWYHPLTGQRVEAGSLANGQHRLTPPTAWAPSPVVLHVYANDGSSAKSALEADTQGWTNIMPPPDLAGWNRVPVPPGGTLGRGQWYVDTGKQLLICDGDGGHDMLLTAKQYGDVIFHFEFRYTKVEGKQGYNSGAYTRNSKDGAIWHQAQFGDASGGFLFGRTKTADGKGKSFNVNKQVTGNRVKPAGEWNTMEITARGETLTLWVNGAVTCLFDGCGVTRGHVGLEGEGYRIEFRNLKIKELH
jgi:hypothetical protein